MNMKIKGLALSLPIALLSLNGCVPMEEIKQTPTINSFQIPLLTPVEAGKSIQKKGSITMSVAPYKYDIGMETHKEYQRTFGTGMETLGHPLDRRIVSTAVVSPAEVKFKIKINNNLAHVLHLAGAVITFQVGGNVVEVPQTRYSGFSQGILIPGKEAEFDVAGPDVTTIADNATIAFMIYDLATATDDAGTPTKKSTFEFDYTLSHVAKNVQIPAPKMGHISLTQHGMNILHGCDGGSGGWVPCPAFDSVL